MDPMGEIEGVEFIKSQGTRSQEIFMDDMDRLDANA